MTSPGAGSTGQRLGRYHLAEPLGGGPTGEVFRAKVYGVAGFERQFAVKRFHAEFIKDPETAAAISTAARNYGSLEHPRIARLHEYGVTGGTTFTATELVQGLDLSRLVSIADTLGRPLPSGAVTALLSQAARAVGYAHGRGIFHLGLCPTNLIATPDGEVKITDFAFLPPRLPNRPGNDDSLYARIPYLAPEQLVAEPTSAATDVFQLGSIMYELLSGRRAFTGSSSLEVAQSVLSAQPSQPDLSKPISKVVQRCLARSPFERYPDARALADAIDAAVRASPLYGSQHDIGTTVRLAREHIAELGDEQVSGAVSFPLPAPPRIRPESQTSDADDDRLSTRPMARFDRGKGNSPAARSDSVNELPATQVVEFGPLSSTPTLDERATTNKLDRSELKGETGELLFGIEAPGMPPVKMPPLLHPSNEIDEEVPTRIHERDKGFVTVPPEQTPVPAAGSQEHSAVAAKSPPPISELELGSAGARKLPAPMAAGAAPPIPTSGLPQPPAASAGSGPPQPPAAGAAIPQAIPRRHSGAGPGAPARPVQRPPGAPRVVRSSPSSRMQRPPPSLSGVQARTAHNPSGPVSSVNPQPTSADRHVQQAYPTAPPGGNSQEVGPYVQTLPRPGNAKKWIAVVALCIGIASMGYLVYDRATADDSAVAERHPSSLPAGDAAVDPAQAGDGGVAAQDNPATGAGSDGGVASASEVGQDGQKFAVGDDELARSDKLTIRSEPQRARVYLDGSRQGETPLTLDATADRHRLALILPGHKLYTAEIEGHGEIEIKLEPVTLPEGPGGIKVRCRKKNRYYVFVDGIDTGQLCPSERIGVGIGMHIVEIYDPINDSRRQFKANVEDTHRSLRVRVE
ncbi:MAG: protein kinase [Proteobacteria bacterium]|nr:protein kinase [Pseudomonadota bacterium]